MIRPLTLLTALSLAACGDDPAPGPAEGDDNRRAEGQVQGGTISDAMIPLDALTSQSPPMKPRPAASGAVAGEEAASAGAAEPASQPAEAATTEQAETEPAPAETPEE